MRGLGWMISEDTAFQPLGSTQSTFLPFCVRGQLLRLPGGMLQTFPVPTLGVFPNNFKTYGTICSLPWIRLWFPKFENTTTDQRTNMFEKGHAALSRVWFAFPQSCIVHINACMNQGTQRASGNELILFGPQNNFIRSRRSLHLQMHLC